MQLSSRVVALIFSGKEALVGALANRYFEQEYQITRISLLTLGFTHKDSLGKLDVNTINAANHTLIVHDDRAQVPILHDDMVVRDNVQIDSVVYNVVDSSGVDNNIFQSVAVYDNVFESVDELTIALHFVLQLILSVRQDSVH